MKTKTCKEHNANPGKIVKGGGICVECGNLVLDPKEKPQHTPTKNINRTQKEKLPCMTNYLDTRRI